MTPDGASPLAILACGGQLPLVVAQAATDAGRSVYVVGIDGFADPDALRRFPHRIVNIGQIGAMLSAWRSAGCHELVIAGAMRRPNLWRIRVDGGFFRAIRTALSLTRGGDDSLLRRVIGFFEREGFRVIGPHAVVPHLLAPAGRIGERDPDDTHVRAISRASTVIAALGRFDVGQAAVATQHRVIALEGVKGTDAMLGDVARLAPDRARAGVLVKLPKPGQEMRIDLPTIGPETVRRAAAAGLAGIAIAAGQSLVFERATVTALADAAGIFLVGVEPMTGSSATVPDLTVGSAPVVLGRTKPSAREQADIVLGRQVLAELTRLAAGCGVVVARDHVLAIDAALPLPVVVLALGRGSHWGLRAFRRSIGVLVAGDVWGHCGSETMAVLDAAEAAGLAGVALTRCTDPAITGAIVAAADARGLFVVEFADGAIQRAIDA